MISFRGFGKTYGKQQAVRNLDLNVRAGEVVALLGPNGSGKTTSLKAAAGLVKPTTGVVLVGNPGQPSSEPDARRCLSFLPQRVAFQDSLSGQEVLNFHRQIRGVDAAHAAAALGVASLNGAVARAVSTYSGGMLQRLGLAVALLPDAPVFLLDEPTAALDPDGLEAFYKVIAKSRADGRAVLFTSHQMGDAERLADRFAILVDGVLVADIAGREMKDRLAERGNMRLRVPSLDASTLAGLRVMAPDAVFTDGELVVRGPAGMRPRVIELILARGHQIVDLVAEDGRLDDLYREMVGPQREPR
ncbi:MAG: ABC transporter ATP-binding protein [Vicinamibacteria bacterium]|nr:ABC transporter ATP-binding protein [Vicinamibacteria bacterium]